MTKQARLRAMTGGAVPYGLSMAFDSAAKAFLRERGAEQIEHPGGTLYAHLCRVEERLAALGAEPWVQLAGLTHAAYGTDGFARTLVEWTDREPLRSAVGLDAEELAYLYGACDRDRTWPTLAETGAVHDRFADEARPLDERQKGPFADLSIVNELDVIEQSPALMAKHGDYFRDLFERWAPLTSPRVAAEIRQVIG